MPRAILIRSSSRAQTRRLARTILRAGSPRSDRALVLALSGALGSGKTVFVEGLARSLGLRERLGSPTFVLAKFYDLGRRRMRWRRFVHVDAYRLASVRQARVLGLQIVFRDPRAIVAVEWAERIRTLIPRDALWIRFSHGTRPSERVIRATMKNTELRTSVTSRVNTRRDS